MPEIIDLKEELLKLIALQETDSNIYDLRSALESFPLRIKEMDDSLEAKKNGLNQADAEFKKLQIFKSEKEKDMLAKEEKIRKYEADLFQIKNNKEYNALKQEIESIKADVSLIEEDIIGLFDSIEAAQSKLNSEKALFDKEKEASDKEKAVIKEEEKKVSEQLKAITIKRTAAAQTVDKEILARYERILSNRGRRAMSRIAGGFCGECSMSLRPQVINEVKIKKNIIYCENCGRILYDDGE